MSAITSNLRWTCVKCELGLSVFRQRGNNSQANTEKAKITRWKMAEDHGFKDKQIHLLLPMCLCLYLPVTHPLAPSLSLLLLSPRIIAFVVLSLILSWASLGAGTSTAVVRKHCLCFEEKSFFLKNLVTLASLFIYSSAFDWTLCHSWKPVGSFWTHWTHRHLVDGWWFLYLECIAVNRHVFLDIIPG